MKSISICLLLGFCMPIQAQNLTNLINKAVATTKPTISNDQIGKGLKEALRIGAERACVQLSQPDGFFKNSTLKILMPPEAQKAENTLRKMGLNQLADDFILSLNRAAEDAAAKAAPIFLQTIQEITLTDAVTILRGNERAATTYLQSKTQASLAEAFKPSIQASLSKVNATKYWESIIKTVQAIPFMKIKMNPDLSAYITEKTLDGIYFQMANEEKEIRANPAARTNELLQQVFN